MAFNIMFILIILLGVWIQPVKYIKTQEGKSINCFNVDIDRFNNIFTNNVRLQIENYSSKQTNNENNGNKSLRSKESNNM